MKKKLVMLLVTISWSVYAHAYIFTTTIDNISYDVNTETKTAAVRGGSGDFISIPSSIKYNDERYSVTSIGWEAFENHTDLISVTLPSSIFAIGEAAFCRCSSLVSINIPSSVRRIQRAAFAWCSALGNVVLPDNIILEDGAFRHCTNFTSVSIPANTELGNDVFSGCTSLKDVEIPNDIISLGSGLFSECTGLLSAKVDYPTTGKQTFEKCSSLVSVVLTDKVKIIDTWAFTSCTLLSSVSMTNSLDSIKEQSFQNCTAITEFVIPDNVTYLGKNVFSSCTNLKSLVIGRNVLALQEGLLHGCEALKSLAIKGNPSYNYNFDGAWGTKEDYPYFSKLIISDLTAWCSTDFSSTDCNPLCFAKHLYSDEDTEITDLVIPDNVSTINRYCFAKCLGFKSVTIPKNVDYIDYQVFIGCSNLVSAKICGSPTIGGSCFAECSSLSKIIIPDIKDWCKVKIDNTWMSPTYIAKHIYSDEDTEITDLVIPEGVESINPMVFNTIIGLTSVKLPNSLLAIDDYTFYGCTNLAQLTIGNGLRSISKTAFEDCKNIKKLIIPDIASWCSKTIEGRGYITNLKPYLYSDEETQIKELTIPEGVDYICPDAFQRIQGFTSVSLPSTLKSIGGYAFYYCTGLVSASMNEGLETIGKCVYEGCGIRYITIPSTVTTIGKNTFALSNLQEVRVKIKEPIAIETEVFPYKKIYTGVKLYVPYGTKEKYKAADVWKKFSRIYEMEPEWVIGDANCDTKVDLADVLTIVNHISGKDDPKFDEKAADANGDGKVDIADIIWIINSILN